MILDFEYATRAGETQTLRRLLSPEFGQRLPPRSEARLANTLGVATLIIYSEDGQQIPHLVMRSRDPSVFNVGGAWHCTSSFAARWKEDLRLNESTFDQMILHFVFEKLKKEAGLDMTDVFDVQPVAFCRELIRAGKPELFFIGFTNLNYDQLVEKVYTARSAAIEARELVEVEKMPLLWSPRLFKTSEDILREFTRSSFTPEGACSV